MAEKDSQNNPVFTYRAGFRAAADRVQWLLIGSGAPLFCAGVLFYLISGRALPAGIMLLASAVLAVGGIAWGFFWRQKIRTEFAQKFGPEHQRDGL